MALSLSFFQAMAPPELLLNRIMQRAECEPVAGATRRESHRRNSHPWPAEHHPPPEAWLSFAHDRVGFPRQEACPQPFVRPAQGQQIRSQQLTQSFSQRHQSRRSRPTPQKKFRDIGFRNCGKRGRIILSDPCASRFSSHWGTAFSSRSLPTFRRPLA